MGVCGVCLVYVCVWDVLVWCEVYVYGWCVYVCANNVCIHVCVYYTLTTCISYPNHITPLP